MLISRRTFSLAVTAASLGFGAGSFAGESYPNRTIKLIVPFPPGTPSEFFIRLIADRLSSKFGHAVVVENRPGGAGGTIGAAAAAGAVPDGYTLLASPPGPLVTAATLYRNLGYDPRTAFAPVALLFSSPQLLAIHPAVPAATMKELVSFARSRPGRLSIASPGYGTQPHLLAEMFKAAAAIDIVHVPYKGPAVAITDLVAGQVQIYFETAPVVLPLAEAGKVRVIAVAGETRSSQLPHVPTTIESGFPSLVGEFWSGILAPARTPAAIVDRLNIAINEVMRTPEAQRGLLKLGGEAKMRSPHAFAEFIASERQKWSSIIIAAGVKLD